MNAVGVLVALEFAGAEFVTTSTGVSDDVVVLFPSCPDGLRPQHFTDPVVRTAQAKPAPTDTDLALTARPLMPVTVTGYELAVVVLLPNSPSELFPQQRTAPEFITTQVEN